MPNAGFDNLITLVRDSASARSGSEGLAYLVSANVVCLKLQ